MREKALTIITKLFNNPFTLFILVGLYPAVFLASKNWSMYTGYQIGWLFVCTPLATLAVGAIGYGFGFAGIVAFVRRKKNQDTAAVVVFGKRLWAGIIAVSLFVFLLQHSIFVRPAAFCIVVFCMAAVLLLLIKTEYAPICVMFSAMTLTAAYGCFIAYQKSLDAKSVAWISTSRASYDRMVFTKKPNVYLIHLDAYQSPEAMREIYGFDNQDFCKALENKSFAVFDKHFSNYFYTKTSVPSMFGMEHHYYKISFGNMDGLGVREFIGGKAYNPTLEVFANNGYKCQFVHVNDYLFIPGNIIEYAYPRWPAIKVLEIFQNKQINQRLMQLCGGFVTPDGFKILIKESDERLESTMKERIAVASNSPVPYFSFLFTGTTGHVDFNQNWEDLKHWEREYVAMIKRANPGILELTDLIINQDPEAIIMLYGDHGAFRYMNIWKGPKDEDLNTILQAKGVAGHVVALDLFGSFLAIRYPGGNASQLGESTLVNLFRNLFNALSNGTTLAGSPGENNAYFPHNGKLYIAVKDGIPLDVWEQTTFSSMLQLKSK